jgi:hypothetical protein
MPQRPLRFASSIYRVVAPLGCLLFALLCPAALAQTRGQLEPSWDLLGLLYLVVIEPLLPLLAGAGLFMATRSYMISTGVVALGFGAWGAVSFARLSLNGPLSGALYGLGTDGVTGGLMALLGCGYVHLMEVEAQRLGLQKTGIVHGIGIAFAVTAFVLFFVTNGSGEVGDGLYFIILIWSFGAASATGSFGGVVATMALTLVAMVHGVWGAALARGVSDAGQAYIAILFVPPLLVPVIVTTVLGRWLGDKLRAQKNNNPPRQLSRGN